MDFLTQWSLNLSQAWPPAPKLTEKDVPDQQGKVFIVTGATSGLGRELARLLYGLNAKLYIAARSESKANSVITDITATKSRGELLFLHIDLEDLKSVQSAANAFLEKEERLDMLWNNAAIMSPPEGSKSPQGYELQLGVNCLSVFLFTNLLTPILKATAKNSPPGSVRVMWVSSSAAELFSPIGGVEIDNLDYHIPRTGQTKYATSKAGVILLAKEYAKLHREDGIVSVPLNPGNFKSDLMGWPPVYGAYTELYAAFSPEITLDNSGCWVIPWGRTASLRKDIMQSSLSESDGGSGLGKRFWDWCSNELKQYGV